MMTFSKMSAAAKKKSDFMIWCQRKLSKLCGSIDDNVVDYLVSMEVEESVKQYLHDLLAESESKSIDTQRTQAFKEEFLIRWRSLQRGTVSEEVDATMMVLVKPKSDHMVLFDPKGEVRWVGRGKVGRER